MAAKTVVGNFNGILLTDPFFLAVKHAVQSLEDSHGPLYAALLVRLPERPRNDWVLLAGSARLSKRRLDGIVAIANVLKKFIPAEFATRIRRVDVLPTDDPLYVQLSRAFRVKAGADLILQSCDVFGLEIESAVIFRMEPVTTPKLAIKSKAPSPKHKTKTRFRIVK